MSEPLDALEAALGWRFRDRTLLERAVTHASFAHERGTAGLDNERLEFLGDGVLNVLVADLLFRTWPELDEGSLSKARSHLVSEASFAAHARQIGVGAALRLAAGESLLADAFEAIFAALFLDGGFEAAREAAGRILGPEVAALDVAALAAKDAKTALQELVQARGEPLPDYRLVSESGPPHERTFVYEVRVGEQRATGEGSSKKEAQRAAAASLLALLSPGRAG